jgi:hypothetical protein
MHVAAVGRTMVWVEFSEDHTAAQWVLPRGGRDLMVAVRDSPL